MIRACKLQFARFSAKHLTHAKCKVTFSIKHFLTSPIILFEGSTLINLGFLMKKEFWYMLRILDSTQEGIKINSEKI